MRHLGAAGPLANGVPETPEPIGRRVIAALAGFNLRELSGRPGGGFPHFGMRGDPTLTWSGLTATPQIFQGNPQMGKTTGVSVQTYPALPSDNPPPAVVNWLPDWTAGLGGS